MKKKAIEAFDGPIETVEDAIKILLTLPKGYRFHPLGEKCIIDVDHINKCVHMDAVGNIKELVESTLKDLEDHDEPTEIDVPDEELVPYNPDIYCVMGYTEGTDPWYCDASLMGIFSTEKLANECGDELVAADRIDYYNNEVFKIDEFGKE
jgi:predicted acetyltransferase